MMAFGAKIKLTVDTSGASAFRKQIQNYTDNATAKNPILIKNLSISKTATNQLVKQIQSQINNTQKSIVVNIKDINADGAIKNLRTQIETMLKGLSVGGVQAFLGAEGMTNSTELAEYESLNQKIQELKTNESARTSENVNGIAREVIALKQKTAAVLEQEAATKKSAASQQSSAKREAILQQRSISLHSKINRYIIANTKAYKEHKSEFDAMLSAFSGGSKLSEEQIREINIRFLGLANTCKSAGLETKTFFDTLKSGWEKFGGWSLVTKSLTAAYRVITKMVGAVKDLDAAMTELKKVTDLSDESYEKYIKTASKSAQSIGASLADTINATADFARLGYELKDSAVLAEAALIYKNVGDGIDDVSVASESLISTIKAFGLEANDAMGIIDKFNEVGNNFAISSEGIGTALQKSASSLSAANNTLEESIALATGMNAVIQNPETVGTTLKTVSMYLRAAKTEAEAAGESTDGMANSVSELRDEIQTLTNNKVDIMIDDKTFKSTYQIMKELSEVWTDISDIDQANILELIGGKRNATAVTSLLTNFDDAEAALLTALDATGSATVENEKYLDSIAGKFDVLKAKFETFSNTVINNDLIGVIIDIGSGILTVLNYLDEINFLLPAIITTVAGASKFKNFFIGAKDMYGSIKWGSKDVDALTTAISNQESVYRKLAMSILETKDKKVAKAVQTNLNRLATQENTQALLQETVAIALNEESVNDENRARIQNIISLVSDKEATEDEIRANITEALTHEGVEEALSEETAQRLISIAATKEQTDESLKAGTVFRSFIKTNISAIGVIGALITILSLASAAYKAYSEGLEESRQIAESAAKEYQKNSSAVDDYKSRIIELRAEIDSGNLSEEEAYNKRKELVSIQESLIEMFGKEAEGINLVTGSIKEQTSAIDSLNKSEWITWKAENSKAIDRTIGIINRDSNVWSSPKFNDRLNVSLLGEDYIKTLEELLDTTRTLDENTGLMIEIPESYTKDLYSLRDAYVMIYDVTEDYINSVEEAGGNTDNLRNHLTSLGAELASIKDTIKDNEEIYNTYVQGQLLYEEEYSKVWSKVIAAQKEYDEALLSGNDEAIRIAVEKMNNAEASFGKLSVDDEAVALYVKDYFEKFNEETKKYKAKIELSIDNNSLKTLAVNAIKEFENESGKIDISSILNAGVEYENSPNKNNRRKTLTDDEQAYVSLKYAADEYGVSVEDLINILSELGYVELAVADTNNKTAQTFMNMLTGLDNASANIKLLSNAYQELYEDGSVTFSTLADINESFQNVEGIEDYINALAAAKGNTAETAQILSDLTKEAITAKVGADNLADANLNVVASMLEEAGVANSLAVAEEMIAKAKAEAVVQSINLADASSITKEWLDKLTVSTGLTEEEIYDLIIAEILFNEQKLTTQQQINALTDLAVAAGVAREELGKVYDANFVGPMPEGYEATTPEEYANKIREEIGAAISDGSGTTVQFVPPETSGSSTDEELENWNKLVAEKEHLLEMDQITQEEYYDWLASAYKDNISATEDHADEIRKIEEELYNWEKEKIKENIALKEAQLENQLLYGEITEEEYQKQLTDAYSGARQEIESNTKLYGVDEQERLNEINGYLDKEKAAYNAAYDAEHQQLEHKLAMNLISEEQYLIELQALYDKYYKDNEMYSEEAMEVEEEIYDLRVELVEKWSQAAVDAIEAMAEATESMIDAIQQLIQDSIDTHEENFNLEKQLLDHALAMNYISEEQYYSDLDKLYKKYFKDKNLYMEQYWENQEEIYQHEQDMLEDSASAIEDIHAKVVDMIKQELEDAIDAIEETKDKYLDLIEIRREAMNDMKDEDDYEKERAEKLSSISELQRQLNALAYDTSAEGVAKYKQVYAELQKAKEELADFENDHAYEKMNDQLDKEAESIEVDADEEISGLEELLDNNKYLVQEAWDRMDGMSKELFDQLDEYTKKHSTSIKDDITDVWKTATTAVSDYTDAYNAYLGITKQIGESGITDEEYAQDSARTTGKQISGWVSTALDFGASMLEIGVGLMSSFMSIAGSLMGGSAGSFLSMGSGLIGTFGGLGSGILSAITGILGSFATGTNYVPKTGVYRTDEFGEELKLLKNPTSGNYTLLTEGSKVFTNEQVGRLISIINSPNSLLDTTGIMDVSQVKVPSIPNTQNTNQEVSVQNIFQIESSDPEGVAAEIERKLPEIAEYTVGKIVNGMSNSGIKRITQKLV